MNSQISNAGTECDHVTKYLRNLEIRLKTYPREWLERSDEQVLANPRSLSEAGFYCSAWLHSTAWIKCFACSAHAGTYSLSYIVRQLYVTTLLIAKTYRHEASLTNFS